MATINFLRFPGISSPLNSDAFKHLSFRKNYDFVNSAFGRKSVLSVKSMKMDEQRIKSAFSPDAHIFQTSPVSISKFKLKVVQESNVENKVVSPALEVGISVFILKDDKILFGLRRSTPVASNTYCVPGGHLEFGETFEQCAAREVKEETGLDIKDIQVLTVTNDILPAEAVHVVVIYMRAHLSDPNQIPKNVEPGKCEGWEWYGLNHLPEPIYPPLSEMLQGGFNPIPTNT